MALTLEIVPQKAVVVRREKVTVAASWFGPHTPSPHVYPFLGPDDREVTSLFHPDDPITAPEISDTKRGAEILAIEVRFFPVRSQTTLVAAFAAASVGSPAGAPSPIWCRLPLPPTSHNRAYIAPDNNLHDHDSTSHTHLATTHQGPSCSHRRRG